MHADRPYLLAVDIGNTQVVVGVFDRRKLRALFRLTSHIGRTADELLPILEPLLRPYQEDLRTSRRMAIASVVPALTEPYEVYGRSHLGARPTIVSADLPIGLTIDVVDPASVGADRIADAVAAAEMFDLPAIVVDLGTATTFDVVLPGPRYVGGVIAPGIVTSAEELFRRAARLPRVELTTPRRTVGRTTEESIQSGVLYGAAAQIDGIVARISREMRIRPTVVATGGLAAGISPLCRSLKHVQPGLTLHGIRIIDERARSQAERKGRSYRQDRPGVSRGRRSAQPRARPEGAASTPPAPPKKALRGKSRAS